MPRIPSAFRRCRSTAAAVVLAAGLLAAAGGAAAATVNVCDTDVHVVPGRTNLTQAVAIGGLIGFECGTATIRVTRTQLITRPTHIDGGNRVTLAADPTVAMFRVMLKVSQASLLNIRLRGATKVAFGGIFSGPTVALELGNVTVEQAGFTPGRVLGLAGGFVIEANAITAYRSRFLDNAGMVLKAPVIELRQCDFERNDGSPFGPDFVDDGHTALVEDCRFTGNDVAVWKGRLEVRRSRFTNNGRGSAYGGALLGRGTFLIEKSEFVNNTAVTGGGAIWFAMGDLTIRRGTFEGNRATEAGGAIGVADTTEPARLRLAYSQFRRNLARIGGAIMLQRRPGFPRELSGHVVHFARNAAAERGGALYAVHGRVQLSRALFVANEAAVAGGAILGGRTTSDTVQLGNALIVGNAAPSGGGFLGSMLELRNATVAANRGGGLVAAALLPVSIEGRLGELRLVNTIVSANQGGNCVVPTPTVRAIDGGHNLQFPGTDCGATVTSVDPFLGAAFVPLPGSPARAAGDNAVCVTDPLVRAKDVFNAQRPIGARCAIGAIERDLEPHAVRLLQDERELDPALRRFLERIRVLRRPPPAAPAGR